VHPDDLRETLEQWRLSLLIGERFEHCHRLQSRDGSYRWFLERATPIRDAQKKLIGWRVVCTDVHETHRAMKQELDLNAETAVEAHVQRLLSEAGVGVLEFDPSGQLRFATREAQAVLATSSDALCGKTVQELLPKLLSPGCLERIARPLPHAKMSYTERELGVVKTWVKFRQDTPDGGLTLYFRSFNLESSRLPLSANEEVATRATKH
jgi:PAS domain-containing protein